MAKIAPTRSLNKKGRILDSSLSTQKFLTAITSNLEKQFFALKSAPHQAIFAVLVSQIVPH